MKQAVLLDRDDTLIANVPYLCDPARVEPLPGAARSLRALTEQGTLLVMVTNQSGIGRGLIAPAEAAAVNARVLALFAAEGVRFAGVYVCPHAPADGCDCRKPRPALLLRAAAELDLDLARSVMIGDKRGDVEAGRVAGCKALQFAREDALPAVRAAADVVGWPAAEARIASLLAEGSP